MGKHILIISRGIPSNKYPGLGIFEFDQARALNKIGVNVTILALDLRSLRRIRKFGIRKTYVDNIKVYSVSFPIGNVPKGIFYCLGKMIFTHSLKKVFNTEKVNIIHSHFYEIGMIISKCSLPSEIKWVHTEHSSFINRDNLDTSIIEKSNFYAKVDQVIAVSNTLKRRLDNYFNIDCLCIPNIVDLELFKYKERKNHKKFTFVSTGNLVKIKRMDYLIEMFSKNFKDNNNIELIIIGDGEEFTNLKFQIEKLNLSHFIHLYGNLNRKDISHIYTDCDCFILLSESETFGVAYVEAMATGLPAIATKCGGPEDFVTEKNGYLIDINDEDKLSQILCNIVKDYHFNQFEIASNIQKEFNSINIANQINNIYTII